MPCMGPQENSDQVDEAYNYIMGYLSEAYMIQKYKTPFVGQQKYERIRRSERNSYFKEALRKLFELDAWEGF